MEAPALGLLRRAALAAALLGACGSVALMFYAGRRQQSGILLLLFAVWMLSPFVAAVLAGAVSKRWSATARATLNVAVLVFVLVSLATYGAIAFGHLNLKIGFIFLVVPFASWLLMAIVAILA